MQYRKPKNSSPLKSILAKGVGIVAVSIGVVCGFLFYFAGTAEKQLAEDALREQGIVVTALQSKTLGGAVRFGNIEQIIEIIERTELLGEDNLQAASVYGLDGQQFATSTRATTQASTELAATAVARNSVQIGADGLSVAVPIRLDADSPPVGAFVTEWTTEALIAGLAESRRTEAWIVAGVFLLTLAATGFVFQRTIARQLSNIALRTVALADGDLETEVPFKTRSDEIGRTARNLDTLRTRLQAADADKREAMFQSAGFESSSAAMLLVDTELVIKQFNSSFVELMHSIKDGFDAHGLNVDTDDLIGKNVDIFHVKPEAVRGKLNISDFPMRPTIRLGDYVVTLNIAPVQGEGDEPLGFVLEWRDETKDRSTQSIIDALDSGQIRAEFNDAGRLLRANKFSEDLFPGISDATGSLSIDDFMQEAGRKAALDEVRAGHAAYGNFTFSFGGSNVIASSSLSPLLDEKGKTNGFVLIATDVTETEAEKERISAENESTRKAQEEVVASLTDALTDLSNGNLALRLDKPFAGEYEALRVAYNESVSSLDNAVSVVVDNSSNILEEASNISSAAGNLSTRTEQQAATLEGFVAALTELTASVQSAAQGASQAKDVVDTARENAEASGTVVREAVEAMGEISSSSEQISRIIGVIDDIAFQTNLLALNAGVEAARAGDAGRGFAVVASEVRALAQRSSDAAREINTLISTSGNQVKRGVSLVDKAGQALTEIVESVSGIAENVKTIASSAKEQSVGLEEINTSISQLDQVTQQNVAMFEETTAATHTLTSEANTLVKATANFRTTGSGAARPAAPTIGKGTPTKPKVAPKSKRAQAEAPAPAPAPVPTDADGALALAIKDGGWDDF